MSETQRYAPLNEGQCLVKDATGNWVNINDHWTVCIERDALKAQNAELIESLTAVLSEFKDAIGAAHYNKFAEWNTKVRAATELLARLKP